MQSILKLAAGSLLAGTLLSPLFASAIVGIPIGGKVVSVTPCPPGIPGYMYGVAGFGIGTGLFWYVPGTITYMYGPPMVGKWILGLAAPAGVCGAATIMQGTSPAI